MPHKNSLGKTLLHGNMS